MDCCRTRRKHHHHARHTYLGSNPSHEHRLRRRRRSLSCQRTGHQGLVVHSMSQGGHQSLWFARIRSCRKSLCPTMSRRLVSNLSLVTTTCVCVSTKDVRSNPSWSGLARPMRSDLGPLLSWAMYSCAPTIRELKFPRRYNRPR